MTPIRLSLAAILSAVLFAAALRAEPTRPGQDPSPALVIQTYPVELTAVFAGSSKPVTSGLEWRVYAEDGEATGKPLAHSVDARAVLRLPEGNYIVHVSYGLAGFVDRLAVGPRPASKQMKLNAGALVLRGAIGEAPINDGSLRFTIYAPLQNLPEGRLVAQNVGANEWLRLPEGTYHVVSSYGATNAIRRADLKVESGVVTNAVIHHRAATVTLKLVMRKGGEGLAGTAFTVLTPGGDTIYEAVGAFPKVVLAEGEYLISARHDGKVYTHTFKVESGVNTDIEVPSQ
jgi:hypothetical protein